MEECPCVRIIKFDGFDIEKFKFEDLTERGLIVTMEEFMQGELMPYWNSAPEPENNDGAVFKVVGSNFDDVILKNHRFVLLKIFAPWEEHSRKLGPTFLNVADHY